MTLRYWSTMAATSYTNTSNDFIVVLGIDIGTALTADGNSIQLTSVGNKVLDSQKLVQFGTAASEVLLTAKKYLIPPGCKITFSHAAAMHGVCGTMLEVLPFA